MESVGATISVCSLPPCGAGQSHMGEFLASDATFESEATREGNLRIQLRLAKQEWNRKFPNAIPLPLWGGVGGGGRSWLTRFVQQQLPPSPALPHKGGGSTPR